MPQQADLHHELERGVVEFAADLPGAQPEVSDPRETHYHASRTGIALHAAFPEAVLLGALEKAGIGPKRLGFCYLHNLKRKSCALPGGAVVMGVRKR